MYVSNILFQFQCSNRAPLFDQKYKWHTFAVIFICVASVDPLSKNKSRIIIQKCWNFCKQLTLPCRTVQQLPFLKTVQLYTVNIIYTYTIFNVRFQCTFFFRNQVLFIIDIIWNKTCAVILILLSKGNQCMPLTFFNAHTLCYSQLKYKLIFYSFSVFYVFIGTRMTQ